jgi:hypothetical protein
MTHLRASRSLCAVPALLAALAFAPTALAGADAGGASVCTATGGTVSTASCCQSAGDFPNTCLVGACSCPTSGSHSVQVCDCPVGQCYDGTSGCVTSGDAGCFPTTCAAQGIVCGLAGDGCGAELNCGTCSGSETCSNGQCVAKDAGACIAVNAPCQPGDTCCNGSGCGWGENQTDGSLTCSYATGACLTCADLAVQCGTIPASEACGGVELNCGPCDGGTDAGSTLCTDTGGTVSSAECCESAGNFPDTCLIGACGCPASGSHTVDTCQCPSGKCYSASAGCVAPNDACVPTTCAALGDTCGSHSDGCGGMLSCGTCSGSETCSNGHCVTSAADAGTTLCTETGGTVSTADCCESSGNFPDTCEIGACGCPASGSHTVDTCECPSGKCYSASAGCVNPSGSADSGPVVKDAGPSHKDASVATKDGSVGSTLESSSSCSTTPVGAGSRGSGWLFGLGALGAALQLASRRRRRS